MKIILTALVFGSFISLNAQKWQIFNESVSSSYVASVIEVEYRIYSLSMNTGTSLFEPIQLSVYSQFDGQEIFVKEYSNDSLTIQLFTMFYNSESEEIIAIGSGLDLRGTTSLTEADSYFVTVVFSKDLDVVQENVTFLSNNGASVSFLNASQKLQSGYIVTLNLNTFPSSGFYQNIFIELNTKGETVRTNKTEPTETLYQDTQWFISENLNNDGYVTFGIGYYALDKDLNFNEFFIDDFLTSGILINRGSLMPMTDSTYLFYADFAIEQGPIQAVILDENFEVIKTWIYESDNSVSYGYPMDFITAENIFIATSNQSTLSGPPNDYQNFEIINLNEYLEPNWIKFFGSDDDKKSLSVRDVTAAQDGGVLVAGQVKYLATEGTWSNANEFIIKFDENGTTSTNEVSLELESLMTIYPNPTTDYIRIRNDQSRDLQFKIFDVLGAEVYTQTMSASDTEITIETRALLSGSYYLHTMSNEQQIDVYQFVKQ